MAAVKKLKKKNYRKKHAGENVSAQESDIGNVIRWQYEMIEPIFQAM